MTTSGFRWAPERASGEHRDGEGHAHVYVDGDKLGRLYGPWMHLALDAGDHEIRVTLNGNDHRDYLVDGDVVEARGRVTVETSAGAMAPAATMAPEALAAEVCALGTAAREDPMAAAHRFNARVHGPLHEVANAEMDDDRARAGRILEAKVVVEELIRQEPSAGGELGDALVTLARLLPGGEACSR